MNLPLGVVEILGSNVAWVASGKVHKELEVEGLFRASVIPASAENETPERSIKQMMSMTRGKGPSQEATLET